jgi:hypothetical protein
VKLCFSKQAFAALAKEMRRASWGAAIVLSGAAIKGHWLGMAAGALAWAVLQVAAFIADSISED